MFIRIMPKLHSIVKWFIQGVGEEQAEKAIQGTVAKPPAKRSRTKEAEEDAKVPTFMCFFDTVSCLSKF